MSVLSWIFITLIMLPVTMLAWSFVAMDRSGLAAVRNNLMRGRARDESRAQKGDAPGLAGLGMRVTINGYAAWLDRLLARAGRPAKLPLERLLIAKPILALVAALLGMLFWFNNSTGVNFLLALAVTLLAYFAPDILLHGRGAERQKAIELELPNTLDQMLISVEAGLGFETAMARAGQNGQGPLAEELVRTLQDMQVGRSRKEAYMAMAARTDTPDLRSFVRSVVQADTYGIAIANVLRTQAKQMRIKRRQRAEEKAMKLPVKVLFPLMLCILPVLFIVIIGPAVINIIKNFAGF